MSLKEKIFSRKAEKSIKIITTVLLLASPLITETIEERIARIEKNLLQTDIKQQEMEKKLTETRAEFNITNNRSNPYDEKIAKAKEKEKNREKIEQIIPQEDEIDLFATDNAAIKKEKAEPVKENIRAYPLERSPQYENTPSSARPRGRKPFTRSDADDISPKLHYAIRKNAEVLSFAKEAEENEDSVEDSSKSTEEVGYVGTTEQNVFVYSTNLANYCEINVTDEGFSDKMIPCLENILKEKSSGSQMKRDQVNKMYKESAQDSIIHNVADSAKYKNDAASFEESVLTPLMEKSAKSTDERGDIEVLTLIDMENYKILNKLVQVYASNLSMRAFSDFGTYELSKEAVSDISDETNAKTSDDEETSTYKGPESPAEENTIELDEVTVTADAPSEAKQICRNQGGTWNEDRGACDFHEKQTPPELNFSSGSQSSGNESNTSKATISEENSKAKEICRNQGGRWNEDRGACDFHEKQTPPELNFSYENKSSGKSPESPAEENTIELDEVTVTADAPSEAKQRCRNMGGSWNEERGACDFHEKQTPPANLDTRL